jgi:hypothetical protein
MEILSKTQLKKLGGSELSELLCECQDNIDEVMAYAESFVGKQEGEELLDEAEDLLVYSYLILDTIVEFHN